MDSFRPLLARLIAAVTPQLFAWIAQVVGVELSDEFRRTATEITISLVLYALTHRAMNRYINPGDAASSRIARVELAEKAQLKADERVIDNLDRDHL